MVTAALWTSPVDGRLRTTLAMSMFELVRLTSTAQQVEMLRCSQELGPQAARATWPWALAPQLQAEQDSLMSELAQVSA